MVAFINELFVLAFAVAAAVGLIVMVFALIEYLDERDSLMTQDQIFKITRTGRSAEDSIADLRDEAIGDMFDVARQIRLQRHVGVDNSNPEGGAL